MIKCICCSKTINVNGKRLRTCKTCGMPMCLKCDIKSVCKDCFTSNNEVSNYFKDKYENEENGKSLYEVKQSVY